MKRPTERGGILNVTTQCSCKIEQFTSSIKRITLLERIRTLIALAAISLPTAAAGVDYNLTLDAQAVHSIVAYLEDKDCNGHVRGVSEPVPPQFTKPENIDPAWRISMKIQFRYE